MLDRVRKYPKNRCTGMKGRKGRAGRADLYTGSCGAFSVALRLIPAALPALPFLPCPSCPALPALPFLPCPSCPSCLLCSCSLSGWKLTISWARPGFTTVMLISSYCLPRLMYFITTRLEYILTDTRLSIFPDSRNFRNHASLLNSRHHSA